MKNALMTFIFLILYITNSFAQTTIKAGVSYINYNTDGKKGGEFYTEYNKILTKFLSIAPSFHINYATQGEEFPYYLINKFSTGIDVNLFASPVRFKRGVLKIGIGPSVRFFSGRDRSYYTISDNYSGITGLGPDGTYYVPFFYPNDRIKPNYFALGYSGVVEAEMYLSERIVSGVRISYQGYSSRDKVSTVGINVGYRF